MISSTAKFKRVNQIALSSIATGVFAMYGCAPAGRTPKTAEYVTRVPPQVMLKVFDGNDLPLDLTEPHESYSGSVILEVDGKKYPPAMCDPEAMTNFTREVQEEGFFLRVRYWKGMTRDNTCVELADGRVFISGGNYGLDGNGERVEAPTYRTYLYKRDFEDLVDGPNMMPPRRGHQMLLLKDKRVLIVGGTTDGGRLVTDVQIFDPDKKQILPAGHLTKGRSGFVLIPLSDGRVLIAGGQGTDNEEAADKLLSSVEVFDPVKNDVQMLGQLHDARVNCHGFGFGPGGAIVYGGISPSPVEGESPVPCRTIEVFGPTK